MSRILSDNPEQEPDDLLGAPSLKIGDEIFPNSAAKFWSHLVDEILFDFPRCDRAALSAPSQEPLVPDMLTPTLRLQRYMETHPHATVHESIEDALAELTIVGTPGSVRVTLHAGEESLAIRALPEECVNAETFPLLVVWLLQWARVPESQWHNEFLNGSFAAVDPLRRLDYELDFALTRRLLAEELYELSVSLSFSRRPTSYCQSFVTSL